MTALHSRRAFLAAAGSAAGLAAVGVADATPTTETTTATDRPAETGTAASETPAPPDPTGDYPTVGVGAARTGFDPGERGPAGPAKPWWCAGAGGANRLTPLAVVGGTVFTGSPSRGLRALDAATGEVRWRTAFEGYPSAPTVAGDRVFAAGDHAVYCLGRESGRELWSVAPGHHVTTSALVAGAGGDRTVFVGCVSQDGEGDRTGFAYALDAADGATLWEARLDRGDLYEALAARDGAVYGGGTTGSIYAFDAATGDVRWRARLGDHASSPAAGSDAVYVGDETGTVHALAPADGATRWTYDAGAEIRTSPAVADGTVYVADHGGYLHAVDARTGERRWRFDGGRRLTVSPTVVGGGDGGADGDGEGGDGRTVYVGSAQGNVFAVDAATGERRWSLQLTDAVETPVAVVDGVAFVGDGEGNLHALVDESAATPEGAGECLSPRTATPAAGATRDADGDGAPDAEDYAPRDAGVRRRADLETGSDDDAPGFGLGAGVGAGASVAGVVAGWWLRGRRGADER